MLKHVFILLLLIPASGLAQTGAPANVAIAEVQENEIHPTSKMVGVIRFDRVSEVAGEEEGVITGHHFDTGLVVKKGDVLAELDTDYIQQDISILRSQLAENEAEIQKLAKELKRLESLKKQSVASQSAYENTFYSHKAQRSRKTTLMRRLERLQLQLEKSHIRAPFDGLVLEKKKDLGDWMGQGDAVARLGSTSGVRAIIPVAERLLKYQQPGDEFEVFIPGLKRRMAGLFSGWVPFVEVRSKSVYMKIMLPYEPGMVENMSAEVNVATQSPRKLRLLPRAALLQKPGQPSVYTIKDGKATMATVNIVARIGDQIGVDDPTITVGMPVVVDGNDRLHPGQIVNIVNQ